ncbi:hypothetical protein AAMO2058_001156600 [Amorphochlora amoebiformis]
MEAQKGEAKTRPPDYKLGSFVANSRIATIRPHGEKRKEYASSSSSGLTERKKSTISGHAPAARKISWRTLEKVASEAQSFDILLFHSKDRIVAQLIRGLTWSEWDHIMLFFRDTFSGRLFLLEAAQSSIRKGIQLIPFARFASVFKLYKEKYSRICYRKLIIPGGATPKQLHELSEFARKVRGLSYGISSLFAFFTFTEGLSEQRTFFCSELVAAAYRHCGILSPHICTASVYPSHFGEDYNLTLLKGAKLGPIRDLRENVPHLAMIEPPSPPTPAPGPPIRQKECKRSTGPLLPCPKSIKSGAGELGGKARDLEEEPYGGYDSPSVVFEPLSENEIESAVWETHHRTSLSEQDSAIKSPPSGRRTSAPQIFPVPVVNEETKKQESDPEEEVVKL